MSGPDQKLIVECRIEAGCLGPSGADHIADFCDFARDKFSLDGHEQLDWQLVPRENVEQAEVQYRLAGKRLSAQQAKKYLSLLGIDITDLETQIDDKLVTLIEQYLDYGSKQ